MIALLKFLTPSAKLNFVAKHLGVDPSVLGELDGFLGRLSSNPMIAGFTGGAPLSLDGIVSLVTSPQAKATATSFLPAIQSLIATDEGSQALAGQIISLVEADPSGVSVLKILEKVSKLGIVGFGDTVHESASDFLARAVFPLVRTIAGPAPLTPVQQASPLIAPFVCRQCKEPQLVDESTVRVGYHVCRFCGFSQIVNIL